MPETPEVLFTKSAFKIATHCPTQAYYYRNSKGKNLEYENQSATDEFLKSMAEGGFQVGELAKIYGEVPPENDLEGCFGYDVPLKRTHELFEQENVNIAEAAFRFGDCFVRADVVKKKGNFIDLIEVKAKSWDPDENFVTTPSRGVNAGRAVVGSGIRDYLYDVAFQKWVVENALKIDYPNKTFTVRAYLMMADKSKVNTIPRLNSLFRIKKSVGIDGEKRAHAEVAPEAIEILKNPHEHVLTPFYVDDECRLIIEGNTAGFKDEDFEKPLLKELSGTGIKRDDWIRSGIYFIKDITEAVYPRKNDGTGAGWTINERKWVQIDRTNDGSKDPVILRDELRAEMATWKFPLHMIDFETTNSALPYFEKQRPYEQVAFQFSHHVIYEDGRIEHKGQFLETRPGYFPNFDFVRELKKQLGEDEGSVFRYSHHENTILNAIREQLIASKEPDKAELIEFIESITHRGKKKKDGHYEHEGERDMIDLCEIVKRFYWHPIMKGSNSIKQVLPAILNSGTYLQEKYGKPIYGSEIKSCNYTAESPLTLIVKNESGEVQNPYKALPQLKEIQDELIGEIAAQGLWSKEELEQYVQSASADEMDAEEDTRINNGGLPLVLFRSFQALDPSVNWEKAITAANPSKDAIKYNALRKGLLKYCELDTMSMVLIWEYFNNAVNG